MKRSIVILIIISTFLMLNNLTIHAHGYYPFYNPSQQVPYSSGQYGQPWGFQPFMTGYVGQNNFIPQPWSQTQYLASTPTFLSWSGSTYSFTNGSPAYGSGYSNYNYPLQNYGYPFQEDQSSARNWAFMNTEQLSPDSFSPGYYPTGLPNLSSIVINPATLTYDASGWGGALGYPFFRAGLTGATSSWAGTYDDTGRTWSLWFLTHSPVLYDNGTLITREGSSEIKTITKEDDGKTFTFQRGETFRIVLPMYDDISREDFPYLAGWIGDFDSIGGKKWQESDTHTYGFEPASQDIDKDEQGNPIQDNLFMTFSNISGNFIPKELVYNYRTRSSGYKIQDTFRVTIIIK